MDLESMTYMVTLGSGLQTGGVAWSCAHEWALLRYSISILSNYDLNIMYDVSCTMYDVMYEVLYDV